MGEYSKYIDPKRRSVSTPKDLVDQDGKIVFGTFDKEFETMELVRAKHPTKAPDCLNRIRLTLWEATEVNLKHGVLLSAVCDMGLFGKTLNVFYDKRTHKVYTWDTNLRSKDAVIAPNLINGSVCEAYSRKGFVKYVNNFEVGKAHLTGKQTGKCFVDSKEYSNKESIEFDFELERISKPSVVSIPFPYSDNRTLYSQKDFFRAKGRLVINGEEMLSDDDTTAIIDDHRGYYPRLSHYDWVTTMGVREDNGDKKFFAFNLTRNQSIDQSKYNENLIFLEGETSILPPVTFTRTVESKDFLKKGYSEWTIKDDYDMVNVKFKVYNLNAMILHAVVAKIDYYITFGELEGYVRDEDGTKYVLDGMMGMGEDKTWLL